MSIGIRRDSVKVHFVNKGHWSVSVSGHAAFGGGWTRINCAQFTTRKLANDYAKNLRKALRLP